jgi:hypothetical protein
MRIIRRRGLTLLRHKMSGRGNVSHRERGHAIGGATTVWFVVFLQLDGSTLFAHVAAGMLRFARKNLWCSRATNAGNQEWFTSGRATPARTTTRIRPRRQRRPAAARHRRQEAVGQAPSLGTVGDLSRPSEDSRKCSAMTRNTSPLDSRGRQFRCRRALPGRRGHWSSVPRACLPTRGSRRELQARSSRVPKRRLRQGLRRFFDSSACPAFAASSLCLRMRGPTGTAMRLHRAPRRGRQL